MLKKFNNYLWASIIGCVLLGLIGSLFLIFPEISIKIVLYIISALLIVFGIFLISEFRMLNYNPFISVGVIAIIFGLLGLVYPKEASFVFSILVGLWIIINSVFTLDFGLAIKNFKDNRWLLIVLFSCFTIVCGIMMLFYPSAGVITIASFYGIIMITYAISGIISLAIIKCNINDIVKLIK